MAKRQRTSFELTEITEPILKELKLGGWEYVEVLNAGIVLFSQLDGEQKKAFRSAAYGLKDRALKHNENARNIFRQWIFSLFADVLDSKKQGHGSVDQIRDLLLQLQPQKQISQGAQSAKKRTKHS